MNIATTTKRPRTIRTRDKNCRFNSTDILLENLQFYNIKDKHGLADKLGISYQQLMNKFSGVSKFSLLDIDIIAEYLQTTPSDLIARPLDYLDFINDDDIK